MHANRLCYFCDAAWEQICREAGFSEREADVLRLALRSVKMGTIARRLAISSRTVKKHIRRVYERLGVEDRVELLTHVFDIHIRWLLGGRPPTGRCPKGHS